MAKAQQSIFTAYLDEAVARVAPVEDHVNILRDFLANDATKDEFLVKLDLAQNSELHFFSDAARECFNRYARTVYDVTVVNHAEGAAALIGAVLVAGGLGGLFLPFLQPVGAVAFLTGICLFAGATSDTRPLKTIVSSGFKKFVLVNQVALRADFIEAWRDLLAPENTEKFSAADKKTFIAVATDHVIETGNPNTALFAGFNAAIAQSWDFNKTINKDDYPVRTAWGLLTKPAKLEVLA